MFSRVSPIVWILLLALGLRVAAAVVVQRHLDQIPERNFLIEGDANGYWELANNVADGNGFTVNDPPRRILRMPGFPLVLTLAGGNLLAARLILACIGTVGCFFVFLLARELVDATAALIATFVVAVAPTQVVFSVLILSETTFGVAMTASLWLMAKLLNRDPSEQTRPTPIRLAIATGAAISIACYVRPSWLLFGPVFCGFLVWRNRRSLLAWKSALLVVAGMSLTLLPWVIRNYRVTDGRIIATTLWAGPSLYDGLHPDATGESDMTFFDRDGLMLRMSEYDVDRHYRREAVKFVRENPGRTAELAAVKLGRFWSPWPNASQFRSPWLIAGTTLFFLLIVVPACYAAWTMRHRGVVLLLTSGPVLYFSLIHSIFIGSIRYRLPAEFALCVLTGAGLAAWYRQCRSHDSR